MKKRELSTQLTILRYPGDLSDAITLLNDYGARESIDAIEQEHRLRDKHPWDEILADTIPLSPSLAPRIYKMVSTACETIGLSCTARIFTTPAPQINAYAFLDRYANPPTLSLCLTTSALDDLSDSELLFIIGHELGHIVYEHDRLNLLCHTGENAPGLTVLPFMGEWMFMRWRQKAEISADRSGWLVSGQTDDGARAIIKAATGLSGKNLALDTAAIHAFIKEPQSQQPKAKHWDCHSAPLLSARLSSFYLLSQSTPANYRFGNRQPEWIPKVNRGVDGLLSGLSRYPTASIERACMNLIADAGVQLVQGDNSVVPEEVKKVLDILHCHYTDHPDKVIEMDARKRVTRMKLAIRTLNRSGTTKEKHEVLSRLTDIASVDGSFLAKESKLVLDLAASFRIPPSETYSIIVGCIQSKGRIVDPALLSLARELGGQ